MRRFDLVTATLLAVVLCELTGASASAQVPIGVDATLIHLFGNHTAFSATGTMRVLDKNQTETMTSPISLSRLDERLRLDFDFTTVAKMPAAVAQQLRDLNMARISVIFRPDQKQTLLVFPMLESSVVQAVTEPDAATNAAPKFEKSRLGAETLDGQACVKNKFTVTDANGEKRDGTMWNATDLKDFPVQIQTTDKDNTLIMRFTQVRFVKPETSGFDLPAGYTKYGDMQDLWLGALKKLAIGGPAK